MSANTKAKSPIQIKACLPLTGPKAPSVNKERKGHTITLENTNERTLISNQGTKNP